MVRNVEDVKEAERGEERRNQAEMERLMGELLGDGDDSELREKIQLEDLEELEEDGMDVDI